MKHATRQENDDSENPKISSEMIKAVNGWLAHLGTQQAQQNRVILTLTTIIALIRHANKIETGHGTVTLTIKKFQVHSISHEETELLPQSKHDFDL
jgi:hypothetical protein